MPSVREAQLRHGRHYTAVSHQAGQLCANGDRDLLSGLELFDRERIHIELAFDRLQKSKDCAARDLLIGLVDTVVETAELRFHLRQNISWLEAQYAAAQGATQRAAEDRALTNLGNAYRRHGDATKAIEIHQRRLATARENRDRTSEGRVLGNLGGTYADMGDAPKAVELLTQSLAIAREVGDRTVEGMAKSNLGAVCLTLGDMNGAIKYYDEALQIERTEGDLKGISNTLGNLGGCLQKLGRHAQVLRFIRTTIGCNPENWESHRRKRGAWEP
jgi:tetratricopeptide (TPR) repeat protein